jgi:hypothetical protein
MWTESAPKFILMFVLVAGLIEPSNAGQTNVNNQASNPDKSEYTLFNPTPAAQMRDFSPDVQILRMAR